MTNSTKPAMATQVRRSPVERFRSRWIGALDTLRSNLDLITPNLTQGKRLNPQSMIADVTDVWSDVVDQVESTRLLLGVHALLLTAGSR
jgi:hypothetical protein